MGQRIDEIFWELSAKDDQLGGVLQRAVAKIRQADAEAKRAGQGMERSLGGGARRAGAAIEAGVANGARRAVQQLLTEMERGERQAGQAGREIGEKAGAGVAAGVEGRLRDSRGRFVGAVRTGLDGVASEAGAAGGKAGEAMSGGLLRALGPLKTAIGGYLTISTLTSFVRDSVRAFDELEASNRKLAGTARVTGIELEQLQGLSRGLQDDFRLAIPVANDLTTVVARLAEKSGDIAVAEEALRAFLDLGASKGLTAAQTLQAIEQAALGIDEGTDKLFGKNPSALYEELANRIGVSVGQLDDQAKSYAIVDAALRDGEKVRGAYEDYLRSQAGLTEQANRRTDESKAAFAAAIVPLRNFAREVTQFVSYGLAGLLAGLGQLLVIASKPIDIVVNLVRNGPREVWNDLFGSSNNGSGGLDYDAYRRSRAETTRQLEAGELRTLSGAPVRTAAQQAADAAAARDAQIRERIEADRRKQEEERERLAAARRAETERRQAAERARADARQLAEERVRIQEEVAQRLRGLTTSAIDDERAALDALYREAQQKFGQQLPADMEANFAKLRADLAAAGRLETLQKKGDLLAEQAELAPSAETLNALEQFVAVLVAESRALEEGTNIRRAFEQAAVRFGQRYEQAVDRQLDANEREYRQFEEMEKLRRQAHQEHLRRVREQAQMVEEYAFAIIEFGNAVGILSDDLANALADLASVGTNAFAVVQGDLSAIPGLIASVGSAVQSVGKALGLGGKSPEQKQRDEQLRRMFSDLTGALEDLRDTIRDTLSSTQGAQDVTQLNRIASLLEQAGQRGLRGNAGLAFTARQMGLAGAGSTNSEATLALQRYLEDFDQRYNTNLAAFAANNDRAGLLEAIRRLTPELQKQLGGLGSFADDVAGIIARVAFEFEVLGRTDAAERIRETVRQLKAAGKSFGEFGDELDELAGLDLSTEAGRKRRDDIIASIIANLRDGADLGDLTAEQLRQLLLQFQGAGDAGAGGGETNGFQVSRSITEVTANRMIGYLATSAYLDERQLRALEVIATAVTGRAYAVTPPLIPTLPAAAGPAMTVFEDGAVRVTITPSELPAGTPVPEIADRVGRRVAEDIDELLGRREKELRRAYGNTAIT